MLPSVNPNFPGFVVDGRSVGLVKYAGGTFRQMARNNRWVQDVDNLIPRRSTFRFREKSRTLEAVVLHDASRNLAVKLDLSAALVQTAEGSAAYVDLARITEATIATEESMFEVTGLSAGLIKYDKGIFHRKGSGESWVEDCFDLEPKRNTHIFREVSRTVDRIIIHDDGRGTSVMFDFSRNRILVAGNSRDFSDVYTITEVAIVEPLGVILMNISVVEENDPGTAEELYGRLFTKVVGAYVSQDSSREKDLWESSIALAIDEGKSHRFKGHEVLHYGLDLDDEVWVGGWLKEDDNFRDDDLGRHQTTVRVGDVQEKDIVLCYVHGGTKVNVHFRVTRNYFESVGRPDGFLVRRFGHGIQFVPRFPGIVPIADARIKGLTTGVNIIPEGPKSVSNALRTVIMFGIGYVPHVGSLLETVVGLLWPEEEMEVWDEIKDRAEAMMKNLIKQEAVLNLEKRLKGLKETIDSYENTSIHSPEKGLWLVNVLAALNEAQPFFFDERHPEHMLPYLVFVGTLSLVVMREQALFYKDIYGVEDPDAEYKKQEMKARLDEYQGAVDKAVDGAIAWRVGLVELKDGRVVDSFNDYSSPKGRNPKVLYHNYSASIRNGFRRRIEELSKPAALWTYMLPENKHMKTKRFLARSQSGPFPTEKWDAFDENNDESRITSVLITDGDLIEGLQLFYDGRPGPVHGRAPTAVRHKRLDLDEDESVIAVSGRSGDFLNSIWFFTSKGTSFGGGRLDLGSFEWTASAPSADGYLESIFGTQGGFGFNWRYYKI